MKTRVFYGDAFSNIELTWMDETNMFILDFVGIWPFMQLKADRYSESYG